MKRILTLMTFFFSFLTFSMEVNIGVENSWPPYANEDGAGISSDIVVRAFEEVGVKVNLHVFPYSRIMEMTKRGELDGCYNVSRDKSTNENFTFGEEPILETTASYYHLKNSPYKESLIEGDKIALMRGYQYGDEFERNKKSYIEARVNTQEQILKLILRNRVDVGILADGSADFHLKRLKLENEIVKGAEHFKLKVYLAFSKDKEGSRELANLLDRGIKKLKKKGVYQKLLVGKKKGQKSLAQSN